MTNANSFCWCVGHVISIILKVYFYHYLNRSIYKEKQYPTGSRYLIVRTSTLYFYLIVWYLISRLFSQYIIKTSKSCIKKKNTWSWYLMIRTWMMYFVLFNNFCCDHGIFITKTFWDVEFKFLIIFTIIKSKQ